MTKLNHEQISLACCRWMTFIDYISHGASGLREIDKLHLYISLNRELIKITIARY